MLSRVLSSSCMNCTSLQGEASDLTSSCEGLTGELAEARFKIKGLQQQLEAASQSVSSTVKRLEQGFADERMRLVQVRHASWPGGA